MIRLRVENLPAGRSEHQWSVEAVALDLDQGDFRMATPIEVAARVDVDVRGRLTIHLSAEGFSSSSCGRCLAPVQTPLQAETDLLFDPKKDIPAAGPLWDGEHGELVLDSDVRELLILEFPMKPLCRPDCAGLCAHCGADLNHDQCACESQEIDPRWRVLLQPNQPQKQRNSFTQSPGNLQ